jgi:glycosyltransferase involved in cell wall biosynthesis
VRTVLHLLPHPGGGAETYIDLLDELEGYRHERVPFSPTRSRLRGAPSVIVRWPGIERRSRGADLVHAHGDTAAILAAPMLARSPSLITTHGLHRLRRVRGARASLVRRRLRAAIASAIRTVCTTRSERDELAELLSPELRRRLVVVPNGVRLPPAGDGTRRARARDALGVADGDVAALYVGELEARKGPVAAIDAVEAARARGSPLVLLIAGGGPLAAQVSARASDAVRPLGHRDDVADLYAAADLFVLPSQREGMPMALLEAMSHGLAPVVSEAPGIAETVGGAGAVVPARDVRVLTDQLARLSADPDARARLGAAARDRVRDELSAERFLARMRELYELALRETSKTSTTVQSQG